MHDDLYTVTAQLEALDLPDRGHIIRVCKNSNGSASDLPVRIHDAQRAQQLAQAIDGIVNHPDEVAAREKLLEAFMRSAPGAGS